MRIFGKKPQQEEPIYQTSFMGFWIKVYPTRVDFKTTYGSQSVPLNQVASVEAGMQFSLVTTGGKKYIIPVPTGKKKEVQRAIIDAQAHLTSGSPSQVSAADELEKFHELKEKGIITQEEFNRKKKDLLG